MRWRGPRSVVVVAALSVLAVASTSLPVSAAIDPGSYTIAKREYLVAGDSPGLGGGYVWCGRGKRVVTGGAFWHRAGEGPDPSVNAYLSSSAPTPDGKRWFAAGINWDGDAYLRVIAYCLPKGQVGRYTVRTFEIAVASQTVESHDRRCPTGKRIVTGGAYWHQPGLGPDATVEGYLRSSAPDLDANGWYVAGYNDGSASRLTIIALCLPPGSIGSYTMRTLDVPVPDNELDAEGQTCGAGKRAVGGGAYWHRPGVGRNATLYAHLRGSFPQAGARRWYVLNINGSNDDLEFRIVVLCLPV